MSGMTDDEEEFLRYHRGGIFDSLQATIDGRRHGPVGEAHDAAAAAMDSLVVRAPSRTHRLLYLNATAKAAAAARDALLDELLLELMGWHVGPDGSWGWVPVLSYDLDSLADLAGLTVQTVRKRYDRLRQATWERLNKEPDQAEGSGS